MKQLACKLWNDERGFVSTTDLILLTTILSLGAIVGLVALRNQVVQEFGDMATAIGRLNQSYSFVGDGDPLVDDCWVAGSNYTDESDQFDADDDPGQPPAGISLQEPPENEGT